MRAARSWFGLLGILALAGLSAPAGAQPVGEDFQVNTYTTADQTGSSVDHPVAGDASGNFVVVWSSYSQDGDDSGVFGQRYDSSGNAQGNEFRVNSFTSGQQGGASVAAAADGDFVVVWLGEEPGLRRRSIFGQRYDSAGNGLGSEFRVHANTGGPIGAPSAAATAGGFVVVWYGSDASGYGVFGKRYDGEGEALGAEFRVNSYTTASQSLPSVASDASGAFVVVWMGQGQGDNAGIFGQRYDSTGSVLGGEFAVNTDAGFERYPSIAAAASGSFVVVWSRIGGGSDWEVFGRRYDSEGVPQGGEFQINSYTTSAQIFSSVASDASGNFVVAWQSYGQDGSLSGVFGQRYDDDGNPQGAEFQVNSHTTQQQTGPSVATTGTNQFIVAWDSHLQDGSGAGVFGQRFDFGNGMIKVESPNTNVKWRIGSPHKIQWTHTVGADATFRIELDRDNDGNYEELVADNVAVDSATRGSFAWTVTGPPSDTARVRVSWTDDLSVSDASDVAFQIRPA